MLSKLLFTLALVLAVIYLVRSGARGSDRNGAPQPVADGRKAASPLRQTAWTLVAVLAGISVVLLGVQWMQGSDVVEVRVVNTVSGVSASYQVRKADLGERRFRTLDGRTVTLAEVERMEVRGP